MKVVVLYQSRTGKTKHCAELIGRAALAAGAESAGMWPVTNVDHQALAEADLVFVGTWVGGIVIAGHHPGDTGKLAKMPAIFDKKVAAFMTYEFHAGSVLSKFSGWLTRQKGADVIAARQFRNAKLDEEAAAAFFEEAAAAIGVTITG